jgi:predicted Zn-dependent peptidase
MKIPQEKISWTKLSSGLKVITVEMSNFYTVSAGLFARCGSRYEVASQMGISHFIEHLLFKGSKKYPSKKITEIIEGQGGFLNAYTSEESTCYYFKTMPQSFFDSLDVLVDIYTEPLFDPVEIEKEKDVVIEEIHSYEDQPSSYIEDVFGGVIWHNHPLGNLILGKKETILSHNQDKINSFFSKHYTADNTVLAVAGAVTHDEVLAWVRKNEKRFKIGPKNIFIPYDVQLEHKRISIYEKDSEQCNLQFGVKTPGRHSKKQWALRILNTIIGENMSSRLFQEIREARGLVYHVSSSQDFYEDVGCFSVQCGVEADRVDECLKQSLLILNDFALTKVSDDELTRAKSFAIGQALQDMESTLSYMLYVGDKLLWDDEDFSTSSYCDQIKAVTADEVKEVAHDIFKDTHLNLALIGPYHQKQGLQKKLSFRK